MARDKFEKLLTPCLRKIRRASISTNKVANQNALPFHSLPAIGESNQIIFISLVSINNDFTQLKVLPNHMKVLYGRREHVVERIWREGSKENCKEHGLPSCEQSGH